MDTEQVCDAGYEHDAEVNPRIALAVAKLEREMGRLLTPSERLCVLAGYSHRLEQEVSELSTLQQQMEGQGFVAQADPAYRVPGLPR